MGGGSDSMVSKHPGTQAPGTVGVSLDTSFQFCRCCGGTRFSLLRGALFFVLYLLLSLF